MPSSITGGGVTRSSFQGTSSISISMTRKFGTDGAEMRAHERTEMAIEIVGSDVDLIGLRHGRDLHRFQNTVPGHVYDRHIHRLMIQEWLVLAATEQRFT